MDELLSYLYRKLPGSRKWVLKQDIYDGMVRVNGQVVMNPHAKVYPGNTITRLGKSIIVGSEDADNN